MPLKPVQKILVTDGILDQLRMMIQSGELPQEERLPPEVRLAEHLSVSRGSLREALNALFHLGYLERRNKGLYVAQKKNWPGNISPYLIRPLEERRMAEMIEVRQIVEAELCSLAAKRASAEDIDRLAEIMAQMERHVNDPAAFAASNHRFHLAIATAGKNEILQEIMEKVRDLLGDTIAKVIRGSSISRRSLGFHQRILDAVRDRDAVRARRIMTAHIADVEREFLKILAIPKEP